MGSITKYSEHETEEAARQAGEQFLNNFPPQGYDSSYRVWKIAGSEKWMLVTERRSSCD